MAPNHGPAGNIERAPSAGSLPEKNGHGRPPLRDEPPAPARRRPPLWRGLVLPVLAGLTCGGGAYYVSSHYVKPQYSTGTTLLFGSTGGGGGLAGLLGGGGDSGSVPLLPGISSYSAPQFGSTPATAMSIMATGTFQAKVVNTLKLPARWHVAPSEAFARLTKSVSYGVDRNGFLAVTASDQDPKMAAKLVNTYVQTLQQMTRELNTRVTREKSRQLARTLANRSATLRRDTERLVALQTGNIQRWPLGLAANGTYQGLAADKLATQESLQATTTQLQRLIRTANRTYSQGTNLPVSVPFAGDTLVRLRNAQSAFNTAQNLLGPDNPDYQRAEAALSQAKAEAKTEAARQITAVNTGLTPNVSGLAIQQAILQGKLDNINRTIPQIKSIMLNLPAARVREEQLASDIGLERGQVNTLKVALQTAQLAEGSQSLAAFTVMDPAGVPDKPIAPRPLFTMVFAAIAGFLLAAAFQIARAVLRQPILMGEMRRWSEKYIVMDPYDDADPPQALEDGAARQPLPGDAPRRALAGEAPAALETDRARVVETDRARAVEAERERKV